MNKKRRLTSLGAVAAGLIIATGGWQAAQASSKGGSGTNSTVNINKSVVTSTVATMPDIKLMPKEKALSILQNAGFDVTFVIDNRPALAEGIGSGVVTGWTSPAPSIRAAVDPGTPITVFVTP